MLDHEGRELRAVDEHDAVGDLLGVLASLLREAARGEEDTFLRAAPSERAEESLNLGPTHRGLPPLRLDVDLLQAQLVERDDAVDPAVP